MLGTAREINNPLDIKSVIVSVSAGGEEPARVLARRVWGGTFCRASWDSGADLSRFMRSGGRVGGVWRRGSYAGGQERFFSSWGARNDYCFYLFKAKSRLCSLKREKWKLRVCFRVCNGRDGESTSEPEWNFAYCW